VQAVKADIRLAVLQRCPVRDELAAGNVAPSTCRSGFSAAATCARRLAAPISALDHFLEWLLDIAAKDPDVIASNQNIPETNDTKTITSCLIYRLNSSGGF